MSDMVRNVFDFPADLGRRVNGGQLIDGRERNARIFEPTLREIVINPGEVTVGNPQRYDYSGRHLFVRNGYLPYANVAVGDRTASSISFYGFDAGGGVPTRPDLIRLFGGLHIYRPDGFQGFYAVHRPHGLASGAWVFSQFNYNCTPLYLLVTDDMTLPDEIGLAEPTFCYGMRAVEQNPAAAGAVQFYAGNHAANKRVNVQIDGSWATPITFDIIANSLAGSLTLYTVAPAVFPYNETFDIPTQMTQSISVSCVGGGAAAAGGLIYLTYMESAE